MDYSKLQEKLKYEFCNILLLKEALNHSSYINEQADIAEKDNQRLEFLGDAVLNFVISDMLMIRHPELAEGDLSKKRAALVNEFALADIAKNIDLGDYIMLGKGEIHTNGKEKSSILSDAMEALIAAIYLDKGIDAIRDFIKKHFFKFIKVSGKYMFKKDYKSRIQEYAQSELKTTPVYEVVKESGPDHNKKFEVELRLKKFVAKGEGKSKKEATQNAAADALKRLP